MDLYNVLGLEPGASSADIKRAYRRLARQYHPGINPGDRQAAAVFQRISEAYETLVDPERRKKYDAGTHQPEPSHGDPRAFEFSGFDFTIAAHGAQAATFTELFADVLHPVAPGDRGRPEHGADIHAALTLPFLDAIRGTERQVVVTRQVTCGGCEGSGYVRGSDERCGHCHATGKVRWARGHMVFSKACTACGGTGRQRRQRCAACGAHGRVVRSESVPIRLPSGIAEGTRLRIPDKGHTGRHGGRTGDLYVVVHVEAHPLFRRDGDNLHLQIPIAVHEAVLGARVEIPSLDGPVKLRIPPGTQAGQRFRLRERGVPGAGGTRGDLIVEVKLVLPPVVDERSKDLMREFGRLNSDDVRRDLRV